MWRIPIIMALGTIASAADAHACTCAPPPPPIDAAARARVVLSGRVTAVKRARAPVGGAPAWRATLRVERRWKGQPDTVVVVWTWGAAYGCGFPFQAGVTYLVYATGRTDSELSTDGCSRTARLSDALADAAALGPGEPVPPPDTPSSDQHGPARLPPVGPSTSRVSATPPNVALHLTGRPVWVPSSVGITVEPASSRLHGARR